MRAWVRFPKKLAGNFASERVVLLQRAIEVSGKAAFVLADGLKAGPTREYERDGPAFYPSCRTAPRLFPVCVEAGFVHCGGFEGPGALQAPAIDGHFKHEVLFDGIARLELRDIGLMKCFPIVARFPIEDDEFVGGRPCLIAFWDDRILPSSVLGPLDLAPLRREASICAGVRILLPSALQYHCDLGNFAGFLAKLLEIRGRFCGDGRDLG